MAAGERRRVRERGCRGRGYRADSVWAGVAGGGSGHRQGLVRGIWEAAEAAVRRARTGVASGSVSRRVKAWPLAVGRNAFENRVAGLVAGAGAVPPRGRPAPSRPPGPESSRGGDFLPVRP